MTTIKNYDKVRLDWVDAIRIVACILVIMQHCSDPFYMNFDLSSADFFAGCGMASLSRPCVPLFVMITGVLLLPIKEEAGAFYRKRIGRVIPPLIFASLFLAIADFLWLGNLWNSSSPAIDTNAYTLTATLKKCWTFIFNFNYSTTPLWYLYMLIGLYLVMPILSGWLRSASRREMELVIGIWAIFTFMPYIRFVAPLLGYEGNFGNMGLWGECDWTNNGTAYYMTGFAGYLLLGYYLHTYPLQWSWRKTLLVFVPLYLFGFAVSFWGYVLMNRSFPGEFAYLEIVWWTCGINVLLQTISLFVIIQKWFSEHPLSKRMRSVAPLTFGIYLLHFPIAQICYDLSDKYLAEYLPSVILIIINIFCTFVITALLVKVLSMWKITRRLIS